MRYAGHITTKQLVPIGASSSLTGLDIAELIDRAVDQSGRLETLRLAAADHAFTG